MSYIKILNSTGPKADPYGTPTVTGVLYFNKEAVPRIANILNFSTRISTFTVSNALCSEFMYSILILFN